MSSYKVFFGDESPKTKKGMHLRLHRFLAMAIIGAVAGGIIAGITYQTLSWFIMLLNTLVLFRLTPLVKRKKLSKGSYMAFVSVYVVFAFQWAIIVVTGDSQFPSVWWLVHGLNSLCIFYLAHDKIK